ncbi:hypothetical protein PIB30_018803 [Stylosanthes scabra]|uniref:Uncharacterized protein n=1 Tax=Stylosanthes scabra TaxID=79078 RepID=A0ABU6S7V4_9FABA|nr:hypothetical protein [Stylosanthes scabra]
MAMRASSQVFGSYDLVFYRSISSSSAVGRTIVVPPPIVSTRRIVVTGNVKSLSLRALLGLKPNSTWSVEKASVEQ